jgi:prepilin-type N-terminal cleavage/methylation domain-containing protein
MILSKTTTTKRKGFTFLEVVVVLVIALILTTIGIANLFNKHQTGLGGDTTSQESITSVVSAELSAPSPPISISVVQNILPGLTLVSANTASSGDQVVSIDVGTAAVGYAALSPSGTCWLAFNNFNQNANAVTIYGKLSSTSASTCDGATGLTLEGATSTENTWTTPIVLS